MQTEHLQILKLLSQMLRIEIEREGMKFLYHMAYTVFSQKQGDQYMVSMMQVICDEISHRLTADERMMLERNQFVLMHYASRASGRNSSDMVSLTFRLRTLELHRLYHVAYTSTQSQLTNPNPAMRALSEIAQAVKYVLPKKDREEIEVMVKGIIKQAQRETASGKQAPSQSDHRLN